MSDSPSDPKGPDLSAGIAIDAIADGAMVSGHVGEEAVLLARRGNEFFAVGAICTHYHAPLADGLVVGDTIRCPWHHACFSLRTGEALRAPALDPLACWSTQSRDGKVFVRGKVVAPPKPRAPAGNDSPRNIVIVGGGAAGFSAAEMLRRHGFAGDITLLSEEDAAPVDRPNLSKDYLAGTAPEDWMPLRGEDFYRKQGIGLRLETTVAAIDLKARQVTLGDGTRVAYDRLLLAMGAEPIRLPLPGMDLPHVFTLRSLSDCRSIIAKAATAKRVLVMGASFIGLEVAASLRTRGLEVHVVAPEKIPMERVLGAEIGKFVRTLHEERGVIFHLEDSATAIDERQVKLKSGATIDADLVVAGVGVRPRLALAEKAGLTVDRGVVVNEYLETSAPGVYAAGDIARWPDRHTGTAIRVEHWVVAQRQGQVAALNMLGARQKFDAVPFFWSQHYDVPINYVGHAEGWDEIRIDGDIAGRDCMVRYVKAGKTLAAASIYRDVESLRTEASMEE
jgi:apoptosis-inducing factor 3